MLLRKKCWKIDDNLFLFFSITVNFLMFVTSTIGESPAVTNNSTITTVSNTNSSFAITTESPHNPQSLPIRSPRYDDDGGCRYPGAPAHSQVVFSDETLSPGTTASYACERGFELLGPSRRTCSPEGQWLPEGIPFCVLNVAAGKAPMQISTEQGGIPQKAIDGSTSSFFNSDTCTLTKAEKNAWWYVNLLEPYMVQLVRLDFGKSCCGNKPATIIVRVGNNRPDLGTNPICNRFSGFLEEGQPLFLPCNPPMPGAFVSVHLESTVTSKLSICEAFVYTDQALPIERCPQFRDQPPGSTATYNGKCYIFYNRQPVTFREALTFCNSRGGTLVDESNPALQGFISWELWRRHRSDAHGQYWMGAFRDKKIGAWKWLNGEEVTISFWNLPVANGNCARYDGTRGWLWSDTDCSMNLNFICQHQPKACGRPEQPPNSTMIAQSFNVGATVEYACDEGHLLVGPSKRTCLETGFYNEFPPICKRISCGYPADIAYGEYVLINDSTGYLSKVVYSCYDGYEMIGRAQLTCDIDEKWNGPPPKCIELLTSLPITTTTRTTITTTTTTTTEPITSPKTTKHFTIPFRNRGQNGRPAPTTIRAEVDNNIQRNKVKVSIPETSTYSIVKVTVDHKRKQHPQIIIAGNSQDNEVSSSNINVQQEEGPRTSVPLSEDNRKELFGAKMNFGAIVALGAFGAFIFLAAIVTTIVIIIRRSETAKHFRHRPSPDCGTVASFSSSSTGSRNGALNQYYKQAWEILQESAGNEGLKHSALRHLAMDESCRDRNPNNLLANPSSSSRIHEKVEKKRHHHHHHHHDLRIPNAIREQKRF